MNYIGLVTLIGMNKHVNGGLFTDRSVPLAGHEAQIRKARTRDFAILVLAQLSEMLASRSSWKLSFLGEAFGAVLPPV